MVLDPKMTSQEMESRMDEQLRKEEGRHPASAGIGIFCSVIAVLMTIAIILILSFMWRSCVP
jgi:hypothetical protein